MEAIRQSSDPRLDKLMSEGFYLIKFLPAQVAQAWNELSEYILFALPPTAKPNISRKKLLESVNDGRLTFWVMTEVRHGQPVKKLGVISTTLLTDPVLGVRNLLIYSLATMANMPEEAWIEGLQALQKYAKANCCSAILAYSEVPQIISIVEKLGGKASVRLIQLEV
jgi:hypothetical protein